AVAGQEPVRDQPQRGARSGAPLDEELVGHEPPVRLGRRAVGEALAGLLGRDGALRRVPAEHRTHDAVGDLRATHEPRVDARSRGDRLPHLVDSRVDERLLHALEFVPHHAALTLVKNSISAGASTDALTWWVWPGRVWRRVSSVNSATASAVWRIHAGLLPPS